MKMDPGIDTGPVLAQRKLEIRPEDTATTLSERLADLGADLLIETLPPYLEGKLEPRPQDNENATYASMLKKEEGRLDFSQPAEALARRVMAFNPWPGAYFDLDGQVFKIHRAHAAPDDRMQPGVRAVIDGLPAVGTGQGWLVLDEVQPAGKKPMPGKVFLQGARNWVQESIDRPGA
jgi:methionyl-tRNA formyltransferase